MAHTVETHISTPAAELRDLLDQAERQLPVLDGATVAAYLTRLDRIAALLAQLETEHAAHSATVDQALRAEQSRWDDLQAKLQRRGAQIVRAAEGAGGYAALRTQHPPATGMWWHLDEHIALQRRKQLQKLLWVAGVVALVMVAGIWAYQRWLAPDAATLALVDALSTTERYVDAQEWEAALATVEAALRTQPDNPELLLWATVLAERLGDSTSAAAYGARALAQLGGDEAQYYLALGMNRFRAGDLEGATAAADRAAALQPESPQVYFLYGNIAEARGDIDAALNAFDRAASLAEATDPQLTVISKMRYGMLLQQLQTVPIPGQAQTDIPTDATPAAASTPTPLP
ncbi:MAG TPA: tetratricopeptide repeat protein [Chloroflexi bacterium]|nr:tetratricopeptide repeat protein [Chloroflexota bacterium]